MISINIESLKEGNVYKNYKELCNVLDVKVKAGKSKQLQLKEFERFFSYDKKGNKFIINQIYSEPEEKIDLRHEGNNKTPYITNIEKLLLDLLVQDHNEGKVFLSRDRLLRELEMINDNYSYGKRKSVNLSKFTNISKEEIKEFYTTSDDLLKRNLEAALKSLTEQSLIYWTPSITVCYIDATVPRNEFNRIKVSKYERVDENGELIVDFDIAQPIQRVTHRKATDEEVKLIIHTRRSVLEKYGFNELSDIYKYNKANSFYKEVTDILFEKANIYYYYNSYEILCNEEHIYNRWQELEALKLSKRIRDKEKKELNTNVINKINSNANKRKDNALSNEDSHNKAIRLNKDYIYNNERLTEILINRKTPDYRNDIDTYTIKGNKTN